MNVEPLEIMAYLAPAIGPDAFEVGQDVFDAFCTPMPEAVDAFEDIGGGKYLADIYALARMVLHREGVNMILWRHPLHRLGTRYFLLLPPATDKPAAWSA